MFNTYKWLEITPSGVTSFTVGGQTLSRVFTSIYWHLEGTDGTNTVQACGQVQLGSPNPSAFTPADSVTQDQLIAWLEASMSSGPDAAKTQIDNNLAALVTPVTFTGNTFTDVPA